MKQKELYNISKNKIAILGILVAVFCVFYYWNLKYAVINYDDYRFLGLYKDRIQTYGWISTLLYAAFNCDLGNEFRTYALLKVITVIFAGTIGFNAKVYAFIMTFGHFVSAIVLYRILKFFYKNIPLCVICTGLWLFNPFTTLQTLHHWLYIMVPAYAFIGLCFVHFCTTIRNWYKLTLEMFLIICCAFFGEGILISLAVYFGIVLFCDIKKEDWKTMLLHLCQGAILVLMFIGYYCVYKFKVYTPGETERFPLFQILSKIKDLTSLFYSIITSNAESIITIINKFDLNYVREVANFRFVVISCVAVIGVYFLLIKLLKNNDNNSECTTQNHRTVLIILFSTYAIYFLLQLYTTAKFPARYMAVCIPCLLIAFFLIIDRHIFNRYLKYGIIIVCLLAISLSTVIHYTIMTPYYGEYRTSIDKALQDGQSLGKKYVLFESTYPNYNLDTKLFERLRYPTLLMRNEQFYYPPVNSSTVPEPISMFWILDDYVRENTSLVPAFTWTEDLPDDKVKLITRDDPMKTPGFNENKYKYVVCSKNDVMIISTEDLYFFDAFNENEREGFKVYYKWNDYYNSVSYLGATLYADGVGDSYKYASSYIHRYSEYIDKTEYSIFGVNLGGPKTVNFFKDAPYPTETTSKIKYGYVTEGGSSDYTEYVKGIHGSNRNGNFSYRITLEHPDDVNLALEFEDIWSHEVGNREFDIHIKTDKREFTVTNVDIYRLTKLNNIICLEIPLGKTQEINVELIQSNGSKDIPFCNAIRLFSNSNS